MRPFVCCLFLILFSALPKLHAQSQQFSPNTPVQTAKQAQRWSLAQWMEQKGKLQWMDVWLNSNRNPPSYYEVFLGADYSELERTFFVEPAGPSVLTEDISSKSVHTGIFVSIFGLYGRYEKSNDSERRSWDVLAQLRLLGSSDQSTNLVAFYGLKDLTLSLDKTQHQQAGGYLTLYLLGSWAIQGRYAQFFKDQTDSGVDLSGHRIEASTCIEYGPFRIYGSYFKEPLEHSFGGNVTTTTFEGFSVGFRTYLDFKK